MDKPMGLKNTTRSGLAPVLRIGTPHAYGAGFCFLADRPANPLRIGQAARCPPVFADGHLANEPVLTHPANTPGVTLAH